MEREVQGRGRGTWFLRILPYEVEKRVEGVVLTMVDVGALARTRAELERLSAIVEYSDDAILGKTLDGTITSWNAGCEKLYGWSAEEAVGRSLELIVPPDLEGEVERLLERVRRGESVDHFETRRLHRDGREIHVSVTISPVYGPDGELWGASAIARDISARVEAERLLHVSERNYQDLYQHAPDMYLSVDVATGEVLDCNRTLLGSLGYERDEVVGRPVSRLYAPASHAAADDARRTLAEAGEVRDVPLQVMHRDGSRIDVSLNATAVRNGDGEVVRSRSVWRDVTERRRAEHRLEEEIARRERFLATLSHELRNPMNALQMANELLAERDSAEVLLHAQQVIRRQLHLMRRLLDDLLDVARVTQGKIALRRGRVDLRGVCRDAVETASAEFEEKGLALAAEVGERELPVDGDAARLQQVVINLLSNAAKFSPARSSVALECDEVDGWIRVRVRDHGVGIPPEMRERIFEPFLQLESSNGHSGGMGLGLTLVRSIAELHGGRVEVGDEPAGGSRFEVWLPRAAESVANGRPEHPPPEPPPGLRVVVVEDLEDSRRSLELLLRRHGCEVRAAEDAASGLRALEEFRPQLAFVDIGLPDAPGYEVARRAREIPELRDAHLVALTGYGQPGDVEQARRAGFDEHLAKPLDLEKLSVLLDACGRETSRAGR